MIKYSVAPATYPINDWILEEGIHEATIINIETLNDGSVCVWFRE